MSEDIPLHGHAEYVDCNAGECPLQYIHLSIGRRFIPRIAVPGCCNCKCTVRRRTRSRCFLVYQRTVHIPQWGLLTMKANVVSRSSAGCSVRSVRVCNSSSRGGTRVPCRAAAPATQAATAGVDAAAFEEFLLDAQKQILSQAEQLDGSGKKFVHDRWERPGDNAGD